MHNISHSNGDNLLPLWGPVDQSEFNPEMSLNLVDPTGGGS